MARWLAAGLAGAVVSAPIRKARTFCPASGGLEERSARPEKAAGSASEQRGPLTWESGEMPPGQPISPLLGSYRMLHPLPALWQWSPLWHGPQLHGQLRTALGGGPGGGAAGRSQSRSRRGRSPLPTMFVLLRLRPPEDPRE
jgi:hypothetical protein